MRRSSERSAPDERRVDGMTPREGFSRLSVGVRRREIMLPSASRRPASGRRSFDEPGPGGLRSVRRWKFQNRLLANFDDLSAQRPACLVRPNPDATLSCRSRLRVTRAAASMRFTRGSEEPGLHSPYRSSAQGEGILRFPKRDQHGVSRVGQTERLQLAAIRTRDRLLAICRLRQSC